MGRRFDRRSLLAGGAALGAGAAVAGALGDLIDAGPAGAAVTNGAGRNGVSSATPRRGGTLVMGVDAEEQGFDPTSSRWDEVGFLYGRTVFDPLAIVTATGEVQPYLAQSITPSDDYETWTVTLRPNLLFHDGTPCDANALNLNFEKQASSILTGPAFASMIKDSAVTGPLSVALYMKSPWVPFPYYLAQAQTAYVAAPSMLNNPNGTNNPVGTGPFLFDEWIPNSHYTSNRNPHYWRAGFPYLDAITFKPIIDPSARVDALDSGTIDIMHTDSPSGILEFRGNRKWSYIDNSGPVVGEPDINCLMLNTAAPPFDNANLRLALAKASNNRQYTQVIDDNVNAPANGIFVPGTPYYSPTTFPTYDPKGAAALVKQIEHQTGKPVSFSLGAITDPEVTRAAQFVQQLCKQVGITVNLSIVSQNELIDNALAGKFQALTWRQFGAVDPDLNYVWWSTTTIDPSLSLNMARNADPRIQKALTIGRTSTDQSTRVAAYRSINEYLAQDLPYIWADRSTWAVVADPSVQNFANPKTLSGQPALVNDGGVIWTTQIWLS